MNFKLSNFYTLTDIDGVKLSVDLSTYSVFVWNDYAKINSIWNNDKYVSCWAVFRNLNKKVFINFLNGDTTLFELFSKCKLEYGYLKTDFDTLVVDANFRFDITIPDEDSALDDEANQLVPEDECSFGDIEHLYFETVSFGNIHTNLKVTIAGKQLENLSSLPNEQEWALFLRELGQNYQRLIYDQTSIFAYSCEKWHTNPSPVVPCSVFEWKKRDEFDFYQNKKNRYAFYIYKEGNIFRLFNGKDYVSVKYEDMVDIICNIGNSIYSILHTKHKSNIEPWVKKDNGMTKENIIKVATGLDSNFPMSVDYINNNSLHDNITNFMDSPLKAAARFSYAYLNDSEMLSVLKIVNEENEKIQDINVGKHFLNAVIANIPASVFSSRFKFFEQGYILAEYLRSVLKLKDELVNMYSILNNFNVDVPDRNFNEKIYALSLWSNDNIFILLNTNGNALGYNNNSIRITMAHELAHILVDRDGALPVVEVLLTDSKSNPIEKRARAFAAEFLLPRRLALKYVDMNPEPNLTALSSQYGVSEIVVAHQIDNSLKTGNGFNLDWKKYVSAYIKNNKRLF